MLETDRFSLVVPILILRNFNHALRRASQLQHLLYHATYGIFAMAFLCFLSIALETTYSKKCWWILTDRQQQASMM